MQSVLNVDQELSERVASEIRMEAGLCWRNAARALEHPGLDGAVYVEGMAVCLDRLLALEHGWLEVGDRLVDPTLWNTPTAYFPGLRFTAAEFRDQLAMSPRLPIFRRLGQVWQDSTAFKTARQAALAFARAGLAARQTE